MYPFSRKIDVNNFKYLISKKPQKYLNNDILNIRKELIKDRVITK
jgi:hypothetical protein